MTAHQVWQRWFPTTAAPTAAELDAEIREELEFHLEMRTRDNLAAGLPADEARRDAERRFGDFEASRLACRRITLGPKLLWQRLQIGLLAVLAAAVVSQAVVLVRVQKANREQIQSLAATIRQLESAAGSRQSPGAQQAQLTAIAYLANSDAGPASAAEACDAPQIDAAEWNSSAGLLAGPWVDWHSLGEVDR